MSAAQGEFGEGLRVLACSYAFEMRAAVAGRALPAFSCWFPSIIEGAICSAPDSAFPILGDVEGIVVARRKLETDKVSTKSQWISNAKAVLTH